MRSCIVLTIFLCALSAEADGGIFAVGNDELKLQCVDTFVDPTDDGRENPWLADSNHKALTPVYMAQSTSQLSSSAMTSDHCFRFFTTNEKLPPPRDEYWSSSSDLKIFRPV
jgi:hypothetical protein